MPLKAWNDVYADQHIEERDETTQRIARKGLTEIDEHFRHGVLHELWKYFPGLSVEDLADCWQDTLKGVFESAKRHTIEDDHEFSIGRFVSNIATVKAIDTLRRRGARERMMMTVGNALRGTSIGNMWQELDPLERQEAMSLIRQNIATLPSRQRLVLQTLVDNFPISLSQLHAEVRRRLEDNTVSRKSVERALEEGRHKVRLSLEKTAYALGSPRN